MEFARGCAVPPVSQTRHSDVLAPPAPRASRWAPESLYTPLLLLSDGDDAPTAGDVTSTGAGGPPDEEGEEGEALWDVELENLAERPRPGTKRFFDTIEFLLALAGLLHRTGVPTEVLETQIARSASVFGIDAAIAVFPGYIATTFRGRGSRETYTYNVTKSFGWDLDKQELADALARRVVAGRVPVSRGVQELELIQRRGPVYAWWSKLLAMTAMSAAICPLFYKGGLCEMAVATVCGLVSGLVLLAAERWPGFARVADFSNAALVSFVVAVVGQRRWLGPLNSTSVVLAGIVWAFPGLQLIKSVGDVAANRAVAGSSRLLYGLLVIFELAFGVAVGYELAAFLPHRAGDAESPEVRAATRPFSAWMAFLWLPVAVTTFNVCMNAPLRQYPAIMLAASCAVAVSLIPPAVGGDVSTVVGMVAVVLVGEAYARLLRKPASIPVVMGSVMLVPSSLGVRGVASAIMTSRLDQAVEFVYAMLMTVTCITIGGLVGDALAQATRCWWRRRHPDDAI
eukprot:m51a1_g1140 hypothetical protein (513) ;mRNA; f:254336-255973